jgi:putrescine transport system permease protein
MNRGSAIYTPVRHAGERLGEVVTGRSGRRLVIALPYLWLLVFFLLPFVIVLKISLAEVLLGRPPYSPLWQYLADGTVQIQLHLDNYLRLWEDPLYFVAYLKSLKIAGLSTLVCLLLGYPMAYVIARTREPLRNVLLMLIILPFWTSFLIRVYAWIGILKTNGLLNNLLLALGIIDQPLALLHTDFAVYLGIVYSYLPFMMLPLFATLSRMDLTLLEAAADLGCRPWQAFVKVTLPLSVPGIIAGCLLVFIPAVGEFVIPDLLGGPDSLMIGKVLWTEFFSNHDWPAASAVAVVMLVLLVVPLALFQWAQEVPKGERRP